MRMRDMWCVFLKCHLKCASGYFAYVFFFKQKTAYEMRISDWSSDVCSSDLHRLPNANTSIATGDFSHSRSTCWIDSTRGSTARLMPKRSYASRSAGAVVADPCTEKCAPGPGWWPTP